VTPRIFLTALVKFAISGLERFLLARRADGAATGVESCEAREPQIEVKASGCVKYIVVAAAGSRSKEA
jgi:hypothetical protein